MSKQRSRRPWLAFAVVMALAAPAAHAQNAQIAYYDIVGNNANELRRQMDAKGPLDGGKRYDAHTEWNIKWNYRYRPTASGCELADVTVSLSGTILLPRWVDANGASDALVQKWDRYVAALRLHEDGHYAHGEGAAQEIEALAKSFHGSGDCPAMTSEFKDQVRAIIAKYKALDVEYDRETDHGRAQGAEFP